MSADTGMTEWRFYAVDRDQSWDWSLHVETLGWAFVGYGDDAATAAREARDAGREDVLAFVADGCDHETHEVVAIRTTDHVETALPPVLQMSPDAADTLVGAARNGGGSLCELDDLMGMTDCPEGCAIEPDGRCSHGYESAALTAQYT